jgi:DNA-binding NarL/FixJ family response regulator
MGWTTPGLDLDDHSELLPLDRAERVHPGAGAADLRVIRVAIADGQALVRAGFQALLASEEDIAMVGEAGDGDEAVALAKHARPDVMLVDFALPGLDGIEATWRILAEPALADLQVLILTASERDDDLFGALRAGASGFFVKDTRPAELVRAVRAVASGEALLSPSATRRLITEIASQPGPRRPSPEQLEELTAREREVMALVAGGLSNREIAERLVVSLATARTHVSRALRKVEARDRAQLVALAYETGLVQPRRNRALRTAEVW